jgi:membrane protease YdiL (CAAX protease family)
MSKEAGINLMRKYSLGVIALYALLTPLVFIFPQRQINYSFSPSSIGLVAVVFVSSFLLFLAFLLFKANPPSIKLSRLAVVILYGLIIAVPEEIIFRGIIQNFFQEHSVNAAAAILISSGIFGLVHLPNGAKGLLLRGWNWELAALAFAGGLSLGLIYYLTDSLLFPTLLHTLFVIGLQLFFRDKFLKG